MIVGQHIQWNTLCDAPNLHSILNKKLDDFIIATDPTYGTSELTYYYQVDYYNSDIIISVYQYIDGCFVKVNGCGYNNNRVQTVSLVAPTCEPQTETCCTQQSPVQCVPQQPTIPIPSATNDHTKLINKNADANFQHVTLAEKEKWNSQTTDVLGTVLTGLTEATTKTNLESTDTVIGAFGKIKKWFSSLKALAFLDKVDYTKDIDNIPSLVESVTSTDNHIVVDNTDPTNPSLSFQLVDNENLLTDDELAIVQATSGTNTGDQDLTPYLLADTELQTAETPTDTSLFSSWNGTARVKHTLLAIWNFLKAKADLLYVSVTLRFEKHTGFYSANDPRNKKILVTYNGDKTVTLSRSDGTFQGYYEGVAISGLTNGYTSPAINETTPTGLWFLYYNGTSIIWSQEPFLFSHCMITIAYFRTDGTFLFVVPETHGFMPESTHEELHKAIGAYGYSGNGVSGYTLNSTTATNRRPTFEAGVIADEDKFTDLALMNGNYTRSWITAGGSITSDWNNTEIIPLNGARPVINVITNGLWSQVDITNNNYCAIFVFKIACGADSDSQRYRCVILQPQHQGTLTQMQAVNYTSVNINGLTGISNEIIFTQKIIVRYTANNWSITSIENISGNARFSVISSGTTSGVNELNVTMDARTHLTGITLDANADIIDSYITNHKPFTTSSHTGTANTIAGFDASGVAKEYALTDFGGAKRLVQQNAWSFSSAADSFNGWCYNPSNHVMLIGANYTYVWVIDANFKLGARTQLSTANSWIGQYIPSINKYHIFTKLGTSIIVVNGTTLAIESPITIDAQTTTNRSSICFNGDYEYFTSGASGFTLNQRHLGTGIIVQVTINSMSGFKCFTQGGINYIAVATTGTVQIYNEALATVSNALTLTSSYVQPMKLDYLNGKLGITGYNYTVNNPSANKTAIIDTTTITAITLTNEFAIAGRGIKLFADYFILETSPQNLTSIQIYDVNIAIYDYSGNVIDNKAFYGYNNYCIQSLQYDTASGILLAPTSNLTATWNSAMYLLKIK